jgi:hypothetical protein
MNPSTRAAIDAFVSSDCIIGSLYDRWQDESQYENWNDYVEAARKALPPSFTFVKLNKKPFSLTFTVDGWTVIVIPKANSINWKAEGPPAGSLASEAAHAGAPAPEKPQAAPVAPAVPAQAPAPASLTNKLEWFVHISGIPDDPDFVLLVEAPNDVQARRVAKRLVQAQHSLDGLGFRVEKV